MKKKHTSSIPNIIYCLPFLSTLAREFVALLHNSHPFNLVAPFALTHTRARNFNTICYVRVCVTYASVPWKCCWVQKFTQVLEKFCVVSFTRTYFRKRFCSLLLFSSELAYSFDSHFFLLAACSNSSTPSDFIFLLFSYFSLQLYTYICIWNAEEVLGVRGNWTEEEAESNENLFFRLDRKFVITLMRYIHFASTQKLFINLVRMLSCDLHTFLRYLKNYLTAFYRLPSQTG